MLENLYITMIWLKDYFYFTYSVMQWRSLVPSLVEFCSVIQAKSKKKLISLQKDWRMTGDQKAQCIYLKAGVNILHFSRSFLMAKIIQRAHFCMARLRFTYWKIQKPRHFIKACGFLYVCSRDLVKRQQTFYIIKIWIAVSLDLFNRFINLACC